MHPAVKSQISAPLQNTWSSQTVEPLPFHGMSAYPYGADEKFPDTPEHRAWRREWNTRAAHTWTPLAVMAVTGLLLCALLRKRGESQP